VTKSITFPQKGAHIVLFGCLLELIGLYVVVYVLLNLL
jgi:hypothetical protein